MILVCEKMNWTFEEYERQPYWFISALLLKWSIENNLNKNHGIK